MINTYHIKSLKKPLMKGMLIISLLLAGVFSVAQYSPWQLATTSTCGDIYVSYKHGENKSTLGEFKIKLQGTLRGQGCFIQVKVFFRKSNGKETEGSAMLMPKMEEREETTWDGIQSFSRAEVTSTKNCTCSGSTSEKGSFVYEFHSDRSKSGKFTFNDGDNSFETSVSAGHLDASNNPYVQSFKDNGPLPSGTWYITSIKNKDTVVLRLTPGPDVVLNGRDGFLIHGQAYNKTEAESSNGCIIMEKQYREKLMKSFLKNGTIKFKVENRLL